MLCSLCPRKCNIDRSERTGYCGSGEFPRVARAAPHMWEEPPISGERGSGAVFFSGCSLRCVYCQNYDISVGNFGKNVTPAELRSIYLRLIEKGVHHWRVFDVFPMGRAVENPETLLTNGRFRQLMDFIRDTRREGRIHVEYGCEGFVGNLETEVRDGFFFCKAGICVGSVLADGAISACTSIRSDFHQGNIYHDDFMEVWENRFERFRDREWMRTGLCADCKLFKFCRGNGMHLRDGEGRLILCHLKRIQEK